MNIKAAYYAFSRMLLPTITVIGLILLSTLSIDTTFGFLMQKTLLSGILRVALLAIELVWFYYLYKIKSEEIDLENIDINSEKNFRKYSDGSLVELIKAFETNTRDKYISNTCEYKKLADDIFLIKLLK